MQPVHCQAISFLLDATHRRQRLAVVFQKGRSLLFYLSGDAYLGFEYAYGRLHQIETDIEMVYRTECGHKLSFASAGQYQEELTIHLLPGQQVGSRIADHIRLG